VCGSSGHRDWPAGLRQAWRLNREVPRVRSGVDDHGAQLFRMWVFDLYDEGLCSSESRAVQVLVGIRDWWGLRKRILSISKSLHFLHLVHFEG
jgi:hypothetical protein